MNLFPKETQILNADYDKMILTTHRIRKTDKDWGSLYIMEMFLEDINSIELRAQSIILLLILAALFVLIGIFMAVTSSPYRTGNAFGIFLFAGFVLFLMWLITRQRMIKISSSGGRSMNIDARRLSKERTQEFIDKVQLAKSERMDLLSGLRSV